MYQCQDCQHSGVFYTDRITKKLTSSKSSRRGLAIKLFYSFFGLTKLCKTIWLQRPNNPQRPQQAKAADRATVVIEPAGVTTESQVYDLRRRFKRQLYMPWYPDSR